MGTCANTETIPAAPDKVWKAVSNFHDATALGPAVTGVQKVGDVPGDKVGARRIVNGAFHETLIELDHAKRTLRYTIDDGPGPVSKDVVERYVGTLRVLPGKDAGSSRVEWGSEFRSKDDAAVSGLCNPIYKALLAGIKSHFGG